MASAVVPVHPNEEPQRRGWLVQLLQALAGSQLRGLVIDPLASRLRADQPAQRRPSWPRTTDAGMDGCKGRSSCGTDDPGSDAAQIVAKQVDNHDVFGAILRLRSACGEAASFLRVLIPWRVP